jgi:hypothetical protein
LPPKAETNVGYDVVPTADAQRTISAAAYWLRCRQVRDERIAGMSSDGFEWICSKLGVRTDQRLAKTLDFPAQQRGELKKKEEKGRDPSPQLRM